MFFQSETILKKEIANLKTVEEIDEDVYLTEEAVTTAKWMRKRYFADILMP